MLKHIFITGATGFIGSHLLPRLLDQGHTLHIFVRNKKTDIEKINTRPNHKSVHYYHDLNSAFSNKVIDLVIHLATFYHHDICMKSHSKMLLSNISFGAELLETMSQNNCKRIINTTSCAEFSHDGSYSPNSLYAATKKAFRDIEKYYIDCKGFNVVDLVLYDNYGPNDPRKKIINLLCEHALSGQSIALSPGNQKINLVHITDTINAISTMVTNITNHNINQDSPSQLYCVAPKAPHSIKELATLIELLSTKKINAKWGGKPYRDNELMSPWVGQRVPNWSPKINLHTGLEQLLKQTI